ncbi:MAG: hypothetical protein JW844_02925 [Candidatus Omnitrophica bacterium]|nr:hypothetical protein [Candidatus Omnitrophota bacterium]
MHNGTLSIWCAAVLFLYLMSFGVVYGEIVAHADPSEMVVFMRSVEFQDAESGEWVAAVEEAVPLVLAGENLKDIGSYRLTGLLPSGRYTKVRLTLSRWACVKGKAFYRGRWFFSSGHAAASDDPRAFTTAITRLSGCSNVPEDAGISFVGDIRFTPLDQEDPAFQSGDECTVELEQKRKPPSLGRGLTGFTAYGEKAFSMNVEYDVTHILKLVRLSEDLYRFSLDLSTCTISCQAHDC